jgi:RNA ligase (TIGR02306 family)
MKLASIETIKNIKVHPNADKLSIAEVLGWQVVVQKDTHNEGDKIVFITIDTIVPRKEWSKFLVDQKNPDKPIRIKNIKLRGEYSSGVVLPLRFFGTQFDNTAVGEDVTSILGVTKYIKELPANLSGENEGDFPTHIVSKTDEDNGLNDPSLVEETLKQEENITITQKLDGTSCTIIVENGKIVQVCSRNLSKKDTGNSIYWNIAKELSIPENWSGSIQGEICGNGIQQNKLKIPDRKLFVFQIKTERKYMDYNTMYSFCKDQLKCDVVPFIANLEVGSTINLWENPLQKLQELADKQVYPSGELAEGIVVRPKSYPRSFKSRRPMGFKLINRNYKD